MPVELRVLGEIEVWIDGRAVHPGHARQRCVLAVLALDAGRLVSTDQLIDRVWGHRTPGDARNVLYNYLARLRRALAGAHDVTIERHPGGYVLAMDALAVDLHRFRQLLGQARTTEDDTAPNLFAQALGLWRGEPFAGLDNLWLDSVRTVLAHERLAAELEHTDLRLGQGKHAELVPELAARAAVHTLDERVATQLMLALHRAGRRVDALRHYEEFRQRLAAELSADPGPDLQRLHQRILTNDPAAACPAAPPAAAPMVPRQLPASPGPFAGRHAELADLTETAAPGTALVITTIGGAGGIGKTWLALHWAHANVDRFPDGQLFVDLQGFSPEGTPLDPAVAVRGFLDALGLAPDRIPVDPPAQTALYRSTTVGRRMLIVADNAATADQVRPLLPGGNTNTVLVTSRRTLTGLLTRQGAQHLTLDTLTESDAYALLVRRIGAPRVTAEPEATAELIELCGGFPLALGIIAGRAHAHPVLPLADLVAELRDLGLAALTDDDPAASLPTVLSWSYRALTTVQRTIFGLLGIVRSPDIGLPAAASLAALPDAQLRTVLRELEHTSLVQQTRHGRYRMHELIRHYATDTAYHDLTEDTRTAALQRVLAFYTHTAYAAAHLLNPHRLPVPLDPPAPGVRPQPLADDTAALAWFTAEHPALLAAQHTAAHHGWHPTVWQLAWALTTFHIRLGYRHHQLAVWQAALDATARLSDTTIRGHAHRYLGNAYADLGRYEEGIGHLRKALALAEEHRNLGQQAHAHNGLSWALERCGDDRQAMVHDARALSLFRALNQPVGQAEALNSLGWHEARLGDYDSARTHCEAALALLRDHQNPDGESGILDSLGYIAHHTGQHEQAIDYYRQALAVRRTLGDTTAVAESLYALGHPHLALGEHEQTRAAWRESAMLYQGQGRTEDGERVLRQLAALDRPGR